MTTPDHIVDATTMVDANKVIERAVRAAIRKFSVGGKQDGEWVVIEELSGEVHIVTSFPHLVQAEAACNELRTKAAITAHTRALEPRLRVLCKSLGACKYINGRCNTTRCPTVEAVFCDPSTAPSDEPTRGGVR